MQMLLKRLALIQHFSSEHHFLQGGMSGVVHGDVQVEQDENGRLLFNERGIFASKQGEHSVTNQYRWTLDRHHLLLEHCRAGVEQAEILASFDLTASPPYQSVEYICGSDVYQAELSENKECITLCWTIQGDRKKGQIKINYFV